MEGRDGTGQIGTGPTRAATETRDDKKGQERPTGTSSIILKFLLHTLLSFSSFFFLVAFFLQSITIGEAGLFQATKDLKNWIA